MEPTPQGIYSVVESLISAKLQSAKQSIKEFTRECARDIATQFVVLGIVLIASISALILLVGALTLWLWRAFDSLPWAMAVMAVVLILGSYVVVKTNRRR